MHFVDVGNQYNTIAIIGPQSSGKSTLLNKLFDTNFEVMNSSVRRGQTTKGVWMAGEKNQKVLIIDCEGTDSKSRSDDDRGKFEHSSSLFALAMSDVLIVNMWTSDVGRYTASNYGVLKIVFEMNLKLFQQECAKKILIMLRDFDPKRNARDKIESMILSDIHKIWEEIKKPEKYKDSKPEQFFKFEFITLSHKVYLPEKFNSEVMELRKRLNSSHENYLFDNLNDQKGVPADGLKQYITQLWTDILNEKELNIPSQKEMLANYRCSEIKQNILAAHENDFKEFTSLTSKKGDDNFTKRCNELHDIIVEEYDKTASNYDNKIYMNIRKQLEEAVYQRCYVCFLNQIKLLIPFIQKFMRSSLKNALKKDPNADYLQTSSKLKDSYVKMLATRIKEKKAFPHWNVTENEYTHIFDEIIESQKSKCLQDLKKENIKLLKESIDNCLTNCLSNYKQKFWVDFNKAYLECLALKFRSLDKYLIETFKLSKEESNKLLTSIQSELYDATKKAWRTQLRDKLEVVKELFRNKFWYEQTSLNEPRNWNRYEEEDIDKLFKETRAEYIDIFENFKSFNVLKNLNDYINLENEEEIVKTIEKELLEQKFDPLLGKNDISALKKNFENAISQNLEDAKRRKEDFGIMSLPLWFYGLLAIFGWDDLFRLVSSKIGLTLTLIVVGVFFALKQTGKTYMIKDIYFDIEDNVGKAKKKVSTYLKKMFNKY